jgi:very-short-patch-repair endonuclease
VQDRCALLLPRLEPHQFFCATTAADLHAMPLPAWCSDEDLHVGAIAPAREPRIPGVAGHRYALGFEDLTLARGMPVPSLAETFAQLGNTLPVDDLVCVADHLLTTGAVEREDLMAVAGVARRRGALALREAVDAARPGSESRQETKTRLVLVRAGLPEPEVNWVLRTPSGRFVARLDLAYPQFRVCVEYDGRQHALGDQFERDADRWAEIEAEGWVLIRVLAHHLREQQPEIVRRVARALRSRGWSA